MLSDSNLQSRTRGSLIAVLLFAVLAVFASTADIQRGAIAVDKSPNDEREYRALVLDNGMQVLLVSDPETVRAAAAVNVAAGSNSDPAEFNGLAHFLEHMAFKGAAGRSARGIAEAVEARRSAHEKAESVLARLHESDARMAAVAEQLGALGSNVRAASGEAERLDRSLTVAQEALAADEDVERCVVMRVWNWAMGHGDVINQAALVPDEVLRPIVEDYAAHGHDLRRVVRAVYTASDFVRF